MIRQAKKEDIPRILEIYAKAKDFMCKTGNPTQWNGSYPDEAVLLMDIQKQHLFVMEDSKNLYACFALIGGNDPTYDYIEGGRWSSNSPYGTIHRIAGDGTKKGILEECVQFARLKYQYLRIDTHEDNKPMQGAILKNSFSYRGIIYLSNGSPRLAYDWIEKEDKSL